MPAEAKASTGTTWDSAVMIFILFFTYPGNFILFEGLNAGRTPGKQALGIRVVMDTGLAVTFTAAGGRNLVRLLDCFVLAGIPPLLSAFLNKSHKRPGDFPARTVALRDRPPA